MMSDELQSYETLHLESRSDAEAGLEGNAMCVVGGEVEARARIGRRLRACLRFFESFALVLESAIIVTMCADCAAKDVVAHVELGGRGENSVPMSILVCTVGAPRARHVHAPTSVYTTLRLLTPFPPYSGQTRVGF